MKVDSLDIGETVYCKKEYNPQDNHIPCNTKIHIGESGVILGVWNFCWRIHFEKSGFNIYIQFDNFSNFFCFKKEYRKLKLEKLRNGSI